MISFLVGAGETAVGLLATLVITVLANRLWRRRRSNGGRDIDETVKVRFGNFFQRERTYRASRTQSSLTAEGGEAGNGE